MSKEDILKNKVGKDPGFRVPEGYFDDIYAKISSSLPEKQIEKPKPMTTWQKIRPYVYLAAMFAGIWCMMKMFHTMTIAPTVSLENPPAAIAEAMNSSEYVDEYISPADMNDYDMEIGLGEEYSDFNEFVEDFDYQLDEDIASLDIDELMK